MTMGVLSCSWRHGDLFRSRWNHHGDRDDRRGLVAGLRPRRPLWNVSSQLRGIDLASSPPDLPTWTPTPPFQIITAAASAEITRRHSRRSSGSGRELLGLDPSPSYHRPVSSPALLAPHVFHFQTWQFHDVVMSCAKRMLSLATCRQLRVEQKFPPTQMSSPVNVMQYNISHN